MLKILKDKIIKILDKTDNIKKHKKEINILFRRVFSRKWACLMCRFNNEEIISICSHCGVENLTEKKLIDDEAVQTKGEIEIETKWQCTICTTFNNFPSTKCLTCETTFQDDSFQPRFSPLGWIGSISYENIRKKLKCKYSKKLKKNILNSCLCDYYIFK